MQRTVGFHTLGCKLNFSETSTVARMFRDRGYAVAAEDEPADVFIINTCSVTEEADKKCRKAVRQALRHNPNAFVAVMGCYAQLKPQEIADIPGVDAVLGAAEKFRLFELIPDFQKKENAEIHRCSIAETTEFEASWSQEERTRAFLKVQDGCDYKCSFCTIPLARGASRSDSPQQILGRVEEIVAAGVQEIVLTGINLGDYRGPGGETFYDLAVLLDRHPIGPARYRISSIEPNLLTDKLIAFVAGSRRFMPHFHIPLQSGSDAVLAAMRRRYRSSLYASRVALIKTLMPHASIGCDVIVGFPTETDEQFEETYRLLTSLDVTYLHVFAFSARQDTLAAAMPLVYGGPAVQAERSQRLRMLSAKKKHHHSSQHLGTARAALMEADLEDGCLTGHTDNYIQVRVPAHMAAPNQLLHLHLHQLLPGGAVEAMPVAEAVR